MKAEVPAQAQRMSSLLAADKAFAPCRVERRAYAMRGERAWGDGSASIVHTGRARLKADWGQGTRRAHEEHLAHVRDLGRVEAERLVERPRVLPSQKGGHEMREEVRPGEGVGRRRRKWHARGGPDSRLGGEQGTRGAHLKHAVYISVTFDVSKLSGWLNARVSCRVERAGMRCAARCGLSARAWGGGDASGMHEEGPTQGCVGGAGHARSARRTSGACS